MEAATAPLPASLTNQLAENDLTGAEWEAMSDEERQGLGLTIEDHEDAFASVPADEMAALEAWLAAPINPRLLGR
jgi:hypothetical protein